MENIILLDSFKNSSKIMGLATAEVVMGQNMFNIWCCWKIDLQTVLSQRGAFRKSKNFLLMKRS